ncbi:hypothetical protein [Leucobacter soli]|uniref:hypothetical protein n=1 Tax=Leucobacter soli TaxID=2812850 RepID=UPI003623785E
MIRFSQERVAVGAEPLELVVGELGLAPREQIASLLSGLAVPTLDDREAVHAQLLRLVGAALAAGAAVRTVVATEDPLLLAAATLAAEQPCDTDSERQDGRQDERHVGSEARQARAGGAAGRAGNVSRLGVQLRAGVAGQLAKALVEHGFTVRLRLPVLAPKEFAGAIDGLIHLALQAAEPDSPLGRAAGFAAGSEPGPGSDAVIAELERVLERSRESAPPSHRVQLRARSGIRANGTAPCSIVRLTTPSDSTRVVSPPPSSGWAGTPPARSSRRRAGRSTGCPRFPSPVSPASPTRTRVAW